MLRFITLIIIITPYFAATLLLFAAAMLMLSCYADDAIAARLLYYVTIDIYATLFDMLSFRHAATAITAAALRRFHIAISIISLMPYADVIFAAIRLFITPFSPFADCFSPLSPCHAFRLLFAIFFSLLGFFAADMPLAAARPPPPHYAATPDYAFIDVRTIIHVVMPAAATPLSPLSLSMMSFRMLLIISCRFLSPPLFHAIRFASLFSLLLRLLFITPAIFFFHDAWLFDAEFSPCCLPLLR